MASKQPRRSCHVAEGRCQRVQCATLLGRSASSVLEAVLQSGLEGVPIEDLLPHTPSSPIGPPSSADDGPHGSGICTS